MATNPRVVVVTGASRGLGRALVDAFTAAGHEVHGCARSTGVDVRDAAAVDAFAMGIDRAIDLWVNNAGVIGPVGLLADLDADELAEHIETNVVGTINGTLAFLHHRAPDGVLVNVSSPASQYPHPSLAAYCTSKAAIDMFTEVVAANGVRAYAVAPGPIDTDMQAYLRGLDPDRVPGVASWLDYKARNAFMTAEWVAAQILEVAFGDLRPPVRWPVPDPPET